MTKKPRWDYGPSLDETGFTLTRAEYHAARGCPWPGDCADCEEFCNSNPQPEGTT